MHSCRNVATRWCWCSPHGYKSCVLFLRQVYSMQGKRSAGFRALRGADSWSELWSPHPIRRLNAVFSVLLLHDATMLNISLNFELDGKFSVGLCTPLLTAPIRTELERKPVLAPQWGTVPQLRKKENLSLSNLLQIKDYSTSTVRYTVVGHRMWWMTQLINFKKRKFFL